jgi:geranylgeranyl pyrophosphate synthase
VIPEAGGSSGGILSRLAPVRESIEERLREILPGPEETHPELAGAIRHTLLGPGKRFRPLLCVLTCRSLGGRNQAAAIDVGAALELVHTYSLVHDDLPCMDDDTLRRGRPTCHVVFGEAMAILAGDALFTLAFQLLGALPSKGVRPETASEIVRRLSEASGPTGLIEGQAWDLQGEAGTDLEGLERIHRRKTGRLVGVALESGALLAEVGTEAVGSVARAGEDLGLAFQIVDDVLDETGTPEELGKTPGKDRAQHKLTYPSLIGLDGARARARALIESVSETLRSLGAGEDLLDLIAYVARRTS